MESENNVWTQFVTMLKHKNSYTDRLTNKFAYRSIERGTARSFGLHMIWRFEWEILHIFANEITTLRPKCFQNKQQALDLFYVCVRVMSAEDPPLRVGQPFPGDSGAKAFITA